MFYPVNGDLYYNSVSLLLPMTGANNGTTFTDYSPTPKTITRYGDTKISTTQSKWGNGSGYFDGNGDYLRLAYVSALDPGAADFTLECYLYVSAYRSAQAHVIGTYSYGNVDGGSLNSGWQLGISSTGYLVFGYGNNGSWTTILTSTSTVGTGAWKHIAVVRVGTTCSIYLDGVLSGSTTNSSDITVAKSYFYVGSRNSDDSYAFGDAVSYNGYLQDIRITKGIARYTTNFTLQSGPLQYRLPEFPVHSILQPSFNQIARLGL